MRAAPVVFGILLVTCGAATAQPSGPPSLHLRVSVVNGAQAVLTDINTGVQTTVQVGDVIQGWTVVTISPGVAEIEREDAETGQRIRTQLPVGIGDLLTPSP